MQTISSTHSSGVSWGAVLAGAVASAAMALILLILGFGLGLSVISPWADEGIGAAAIGISTIIWLTITQIIASGLGGYLTGRLRVKWTNIHNDEVHFRDSAHGLVTWSVSTLIAMLMVTSSIAYVLSVGANATAKVTGNVAESVVSGVSEMGANTSDYLIDALLRSDNQATGNDNQTFDNNNQTSAARDENIRNELKNILFRDLMNSDISSGDTEYAAQLVSNYTGLSQREAEVRVTQIIERARQAATDLEVATLEAVEAARESAAYLALWLFIALLCGAFAAGLMAVVGGRQRDAQELVTHGDSYGANIRN